MTTKRISDGNGRDSNNEIQISWSRWTGGSMVVALCLGEGRSTTYMNRTRKVALKMILDLYFVEAIE